MAIGDNGTIFIVESEINKHMMDIIDCGNKVKAILSKIDDQMNILKKHYSCSAADALFRQYEEFNENYEIVVNNLLSYNSDLMFLKKSYASISSDLTQKLKSDAARLTASIDKYKEKR